MKLVVIGTRKIEVTPALFGSWPTHTQHEFLLLALEKSGDGSEDCSIDKIAAATGVSRHVLLNRTLGQPVPYSLPIAQEALEDLPHTPHLHRVIRRGKDRPDER